MRHQSEKRCPMCGETKTAESFYKNVRDGLSPYCKPCSADRKRKGNKTKAEIDLSVYPSKDTKVCSVCKIEKDLSFFNKRVRPGCKDTYRTCCKDCQAATFKKWALRTSGKRKQSSNCREDFLKKKHAIRYPEEGMKLCSSCGQVKPDKDFGHRFIVGGPCKICRSEKERDSYAKNKEARLAYARKYREANIERARENALRGQKKRYRLMKAAREEGRVTKTQKFELVAAYGYKCMCCGATESITFDHIVPISKGGKDVIENIQLLCGSCNSSKASRVIDYRPDRRYAA